MSRFNNIYTINPCQLKTTIESISNCINIHEIYVSIGGKINNNDTFMEHNNNALYQIIPSFIQNKEHSGIVIVFDTFSETEYNRCRDVICSYNIKTNIILCNTFCDKIFIREYISYIVELATRLNCNKNNVIICNYIKFKYECNAVEHKSLLQIPSTIYSLLKDTEYIDSFYEWFGYNQHMYNYIYKYRYYKLYRGGYSSLCLLYDTLKTINLDSTYQLNVQNTNIINYWKHIYDITNYEFVSLFDDLSEKSKITFLNL